jgi:hypothetical protein
MPHEYLDGLVLMHKPSHSINPLAGQGSEDTERTSKDAKLIAHGNANPLLAVIHRQHPPRHLGMPVALTP